MTRKSLILQGLLPAVTLLTACISTNSDSGMKQQIADLQAESARNTVLLTATQKKLDAAREQLDATQKQIASLRAEISRTKDQSNPEFISLQKLFETLEYGHIPPSIINRYLDLIAPPAKAPKETVKKYIMKIANLRVHTNSEMIRTRIIGSLTDLGHEYFQDMVFLSSNPMQTVNTQWIQAALKQMVQPSDKPFLKRNMDRNSPIGSVCRELFIQVADDSDRAEFLEMIAVYPNLWSYAGQLGLKKETALVLKKSLLSGQTHDIRAMKFMLEQLPEEERADFLSRYWKWTGNSHNPWFFLQAGILMAQYGSVPVFLDLVGKIPEVLLGMQHQNTFRELIGLSPCRDFAELEKWCRENRDNIIFNPKTSQFELKK